MPTRERPRGFVLWMTGLPSSGKSTIAMGLRQRLETEYGRYVELLDGDEVRKGLSSDLGLSRADREEHARRVSYLAKVLARNGVVSIVALISPYRISRERARELVGRSDFLEVYVKASLKTCESRDPKGLYAKARRGEITNMTGIQDPYEEPLRPDIVVETDSVAPAESVETVIQQLKDRSMLDAGGREG